MTDAGGESSARIYVAGHRGMVGSAVVRRLRAAGHRELLLRDRQELDLTDAAAVDRFFAEHRPQQVYLAAARVGGILANATRPAEFIRDNLMIQTHVIDAAWRHGADKLLFLGSSCIYPRMAEQPIEESALLAGPLEPTNEAYAVAKIAGIKMCQAYRAQHGFDAICLQPTNLYGPGDNFDPASSHVVPALIRKLHEATLSGASRVEVWGTGRPRREFLHVDDLADACVFLMERYSDSEIVNVGVGRDIEIRELVELLGEIVGFRGDVEYDTGKPDGTPRKLLDVSRLSALGWRADIDLRQGLESTYRWFLEHAADPSA